MFVLNKVSNDNIMKNWFSFPVYDSPHFEAHYIDECLFLCMNDVMSLCPEDSYVEITDILYRRLCKQLKNPCTSKKERFLRRVLIFEGTSWRSFSI